MRVLSLYACGLHGADGQSGLGLLLNNQTPPTALIAPVSGWIVRWSHLLPPNATVLDVACGAGRHIQWFSDRGHRVTGVDRDLTQAQQNLPRGATLVFADMEGSPWPLTTDGRPTLFDAVVVTNYLWRTLMPTVIHSLAPGGVLLYETFAAGNETVGRPARPDFLLQPGELLSYCRDLHVVAYEHGYLEDPPRFVQRIAATSMRAMPGEATAPALHLL